ncbi:transmembrane signal receptor [Lithospermum erythrorhizon]|uniref:Transmembrane signal receptor n=1 Tax=Lithospermum erythrorhizon TaxID=34254 RepID=A0AAV3RXY9_LITER
MVSVRTFLAVVVAKNWEVHQLDVNNSFFHGDLNEEVYMKLTPGFSSSTGTQVCCLRKSLYGLRQSPSNWFAKLTSVLRQYGLNQSHANHTLFTFHQGMNLLSVLVYVDDILVAAKPVSAPLPQNHHLGIDTGPAFHDPARYRRIVGRLLYLTLTRPDITYSVHILSQFMQNPGHAHYDAAIRVLRYLKSHPGQRLLLRADNDLQVYAYCDSDLASCRITRRTISGYFIILGSSLVSWKSKKQTTISRSSAEVEYRAMAYCCAEIKWLKCFLASLGVFHTQLVRLFCDNEAAIHIASNPVFHKLPNHIDCHFVRELLINGDITTALGAPQFIALLGKLGVRDPHTPP